MSMNGTPSGDRVDIGFFGRRNAGKSCVVNAVTGQDLAVVSDVTDPSTFFIGTISYKIFSPLAELAILSIAFQTVFSLS